MCDHQGDAETQVTGCGGVVFHVTNRGVRRSTLFFDPPDYVAFVRLLNEAAAKVPTMRLLAWSLMKNHWHLIVWPRNDEDLRDYVGWIALTHACRWQRVHQTRGTGYVYQGRYSAIPVETGSYLFTVSAYVECNAFDKQLVARAEDWPWSSASTEDLGCDRPALHTEWPVPKPPPEEWHRILNEPDRKARRRECDRAVRRTMPFGSEAWRQEMGERLRWVRGIRRPGRPRKVRP